MRLMAGGLIVILALVVGCSKAPSETTATGDPAQEEQQIYGEDFETGDASDEVAEPGEAVDESAEEASAEPVAE
jgi:hypothetical protein